MKIRKVLIPADFSPPSSLALNYGIALARRFRAKLLLLHVLEPATALLYTFPTEAERVQQHRLQQAYRLLQALVGPEDRDDLDLKVLVRSGGIDDEIASAVQEEGADIVVMGTHGRRILGKWLVGSVTQNVLRKLHVPVLTVCRASRPLDFKRILFATDLADHAKSGFPFILDLARILNADIVVTHVLEGRPPLSLETAAIAEEVETWRHRTRDNALVDLAELKGADQRNGVGVETLLLEGSAQYEILKAAKDNDADLIVISAREMGFLERAFGTTAEFLIHEADVPVLSIPDSLNATSYAGC